MARKTGDCHDGAVTRESLALHCHDMLPLTDEHGRFIGRGCVLCGFLASPSGAPSDGAEKPIRDRRTGKQVRRQTKAHTARVDAYRRALETLREKVPA